MLQEVNNSQWISIAQAVTVCREADAEMHDTTIRKWADRYVGLGKKVGGRWRVNATILSKILDGDPPPVKEKERLTA